MKLRNLIFLFLCVFVVLFNSCKQENQPPTCKIVFPSNGNEFTKGEEVLISADSEDSDGNITEVRFYVHGIGIGIVNSIPYDLLWNTENKETISYTVLAKSFDNENASTTDEIEIVLIEPEAPPVAAFSADPLTGTLPLEVSFTDMSLNSPVALHWKFGYDEYSTEQNPTHSYKRAGDYTVELTVASAAGMDVEAKVNYIHVGGVGCPSTVTDIDGNTYNTVLIGNQCWMKENLKVTHYPNGDEIPYIPGVAEWVALEDNNVDDVYCFYQNNVNSEYGVMYNYAAAIADDWQKDSYDGQGVCPEGWFLPTDSDWTNLCDYLGGSSVAGAKLKEAGVLHWHSSNVGATNESGFTALPGGHRYYKDGGWYKEKVYGSWWTASEGAFYSGCTQVCIVKMIK